MTPLVTHLIPRMPLPLEANSQDFVTNCPSSTSTPIYIPGHRRATCMIVGCQVRSVPPEVRDIILSCVMHRGDRLLILIFYQFISHRIWRAVEILSP